MVDLTTDVLLLIAHRLLMCSEHNILVHWNDSNIIREQFQLPDYVVCTFRRIARVRRQREASESGVMIESLVH